MNQQELDILSDDITEAINDDKFSVSEMELSPDGTSVTMFLEAEVEYHGHYGIWSMTASYDADTPEELLAIVQRELG